MKLIYDCTILSNYNSKNGHRAGLFFVGLNLLKELSKTNCEIILYCNFTEFYKIKNIKELKEFEIVPEYSVLNKIFSILFFILSYAPRKLQSYVTVLTRTCTKYLYVKSKKKREYIEKCDAYFSPFTPPSPEIQECNIKRFRMIHDVIPLIEEGLKPTNKEWKYWYNRVYSTINEKDYYVTNSDYTKSDVLKYFPFIKDENIKTTLLGANEAFKPCKDVNVIKKYNLPPKYVFSLCSLGKRKNLIFAIENFYKFIEKHGIDDLFLVLGGGVWKKYKKPLQSIINKHDLSRVKLLGYLKDEDIPALYSQALCFVFPSLYEGFGLPVLEAMKCGCPVITSNVSSLPEVIGDAGIQINPKSDEEMITAYEKMYFDKTFREECIKKGLNRSNTFTWEKCSKEILNFIETKIA